MVQSERHVAIFDSERRVAILGNHEARKARYIHCMNTTLLSRHDVQSYTLDPEPFLQCQGKVCLLDLAARAGAPEVTQRSSAS